MPTDSRRSSEANKSCEQLVQDLAAEERRCRELAEELARLKSKKLPEGESLAHRAGGKLGEQTEEALRESEARLRTLVDNLPFDFWAIDMRGRYTVVNPVCQAAWGVRVGDAPEDVASRPEDLEQWRKNNARAFAGEVVTGEVTFQRNENVRTFENIIAPVKVGGEVRGILGVNIDVTERKRAEESLARERDLLQSVLNSAGKAHLAYLDRNFNFVRVNETYAATCGYRPEEMTGKNHFVLYPHAGNEAIFRRVRDTGQAVEIHDRPFEFTDQPGRGVTYWDWTLIPVKDVGGQVTGLILSLFETTARKRAEEALRENEAKFRSLFEAIDEGFCIIELLFDGDKPIDYRFLEINPSFEKQTGLVNAKGKRIRELTPLHEEHWFETYGRIALTGQPARFQNYAAQLGRWYDVYAFRIGEPRKCRVAALFNDITARKRAEEALRESEERFRSLFVSMSEGFALHEIVTDEQGRPVDYRFLDVNPAFERLTGLKRADLLGKCVLKALPGIESHWIESYGRVALKGEPVHFENYSADLNQWFDVYAYRPAPRQFAVVFTDMTARKQAEEALRTTLESIGDGFFALDAEWRFVYINAPAERILGIQREEVQGKSHWDVFPLTLGTEVERRYRLAADGQAQDWENFYEPWGRWFHNRCFPREGGGMSVYFEDITERKRAEERDQQKHRETVFANRVLHVFINYEGDEIFDQVLKIVQEEMASRYGVFGYIPQPGHLICSSMSKMLDACEVEGKCIHYPLEKWKGLWARALKEKRSLYTNSASPVPPGHPIIHNNLATPILFHGEAIGLLNIANKDGGYTDADRDTLDGIAARIAPVLYSWIQHKLREDERKAAEEELRQLNLSLEQRVSERTSELVHTVEVLQEEIEQRLRVENELKLANEQLTQRADQLRRLAGELTAVEQTERKRLSRILHDGLQQHLVSAKMQLGGLAEQIENEDLKQTAEEIEKILREGVSMSRSLSADLCPPILHEGGLSEGLEWLARWMREKHRFRVDLSLQAVPEPREDVKMLVFESVRELLFNALKHAQASRAHVRLELAGETEMRVTVSDEGAGFDTCRLLPAGDGGGFGLFSIRERIGLLGGRVEIDSAPGRGSRVALTVSHGQADAAAFPVGGVFTPVLLPPRGAAENQETAIRLLLVDDHALFRKGIARLLKKARGLEVVGEAQDGQEAIQFAQELKPDVILMDISMPGINGIEATRVIHERHPEVCIIGLSMYDDPEKERAMRAAGATDYKSKGCAAAELVSAIRAGLQKGNPLPK